MQPNEPEITNPKPVTDNSVKKISIYFPFYNQNNLLRKILFKYKSENINTEMVEFIVIDDGSMEDPIDLNLFKDFLFKVQVWRIDRDIKWNMPEANNLAFSITKNKHVLRTDIDHFIPKKTLNFLFKNLPTNGHYLSNGSRIEYYIDGGYRKIKGHKNTFLCTTDDYWECGGSNEYFSGSYGDDNDFLPRLKEVSQENECEDFLTYVFHNQGVIGLDRSMNGFKIKNKMPNKPVIKFSNKDYYIQLLEN